jgi:apolipoprotein N-acyltransferase
LIRREWRAREAWTSGALFGVGWFAPSLAWMWFLTPPGYVVTVALFAAAHGGASAGALALTRRLSHRRAFSLAASHTLVEAVRLSFPFGGIPISTIAIAHADSPVARLAPVGGVLLITYAVLRASLGPGRLAAVSLLVASLPVAGLADRTQATGETVRLALVQGGGPQGTRGVDTDFREVFERHLGVSRRVSRDDAVDAVVWPENVINVDTFEGSREHGEITAEAARLGVPLVVGVTEDASPGRFTNAQVVVQPDGSISGRYDKVRRVPFGEYVPFRSTLAALGAPVHLVPNDAVEGESPALLEFAGVGVAVAISWEIFFAERVDEGVDLGGRLILNPTNGSSYTWTILQTQQVASSRLRAREQGRAVVQVSPTGFTAFVDDDGDVSSRTAIGEARLVTGDVEVREGTTLHGALGDAPVVLVLAGWLLVIGARERSARRRARPRGVPHSP